jgi:hypothetical protein
MSPTFSIPIDLFLFPRTYSFIETITKIVITYKLKTGATSLKESFAGRNIVAGPVI